MNKLELIQALKDANGLSKTEAESVVNIFFNTMSDALANGDRVEIRGLCSIFVKEYGAYFKGKSVWDSQSRYFVVPLCGR
jgi:integration host factor subunit beta